MLRAMRLEAQGKLHIINDTRQVSARFQVREFVVEIADNPQYPQFVQFQVTGTRCEVLDDYSVGDEVSLQFNLRGREWKSPKGEIKYFNSLDVWTIERAGANQQAGGYDEPAYNQSAPPAATGDGPPPLTDDDLPF